MYKKKSIMKVTKRFSQTSMRASLVLMLVAVLSAGYVSCSKDDNPVATDKEVAAIADQVWAFSQTHPDGFTLDIRTMTEPTEGISVSYAATENSHSRDQLEFVVNHALEHDGYVGGWLSSENGLYYFDSSRVFPENQLDEAVQFGKDNGQYSVYILSTGTEVVIDEYLSQ